MDALTNMIYTEMLGLLGTSFLYLTHVSGFLALLLVLVFAVRRRPYHSSKLRRLAATAWSFHWLTVAMLVAVRIWPELAAICFGEGVPLLGGWAFSIVGLTAWPFLYSRSEESPFPTIFDPVRIHSR